jgi:hypothetical protein
MSSNGVKDIFKKHLQEVVSTPPPDEPDEQEEDVRIRPAVVRKMKAHERRVAAIRLRQQGKPYSYIAAALKVTPATAARYVKEGLAQAHSESIEELRAIQGGQIDFMMDRIWEKLKSGDLWAIDRGIKLMERKAKLFGLDAPVQMANVTVNTNLVNAAQATKEVTTVDKDPVARDTFYEQLLQLTKDTAEGPAA